MKAKPKRLSQSVDTRILTRIAAVHQEPEPPSGLPLPSVSMMFAEMKRVALPNLQPPKTEEELERLLEFVFQAAYSHALTLQLLLQTKPGHLAERVSTAHAAETISHLKRWTTYRDNHPTPIPHLPPLTVEVNGHIIEA